MEGRVPVDLSQRLGAVLGAEDLESLATAAYMICREEEYVRSLERAYHAHLDAGEALRAVRCARLWVGLGLLARGESGRANGWFARAQRLLGASADVRRGSQRIVDRGPICSTARRARSSGPLARTRSVR